MLLTTTLYYLKFITVLIAGVLLGRWYDQERKKLKAKGEPWQKSWTTTPGILIIIIICILIAFRMVIRFSS
ncbi:MAG: hypothetical protein ABIK15_16210 [Pseudomonadota bacterium]